jgi:hypothetical protein
LSLSSICSRSHSGRSASLTIPRSTPCELRPAPTIADTVAGGKLVPTGHARVASSTSLTTSTTTRDAVLDQHDIFADDHAAIARRKRAQLSLQVLWQTGGLELRRRPTVARRERIELRCLPAVAAPEIAPDHCAVDMRDARLNDAGTLPTAAGLLRAGMRPSQSGGQRQTRIARQAAQCAQDCRPRFRNRCSLRSSVSPCS